ncbi:glycosyltransferase [Propionibacteriaceae bacterium Y2011]|uniref:glycosyltransferase n=1 Tax=Microlunatus sp. Y2014 TaxID=3418488 RepID=UPI003B45E714
MTVGPPDVPRRIAFVSLHTSPTSAPGTGDAGGMNVVELHQARELAELGHQVELITRRESPDTPEVTELAPRLTLRQVVAGPVEVVAKSKQEALIGEFGARMAELTPYDLVHSQHWMSGVAALSVAQAWGVPHVQTFHSVAALPGSPLSHGEPPESPGRVRGEALVAQRSDRVIAVSDAEATTVIERCGADPASVVVVRPGVDGDMFRPVLPGDRPWRSGIDPYLVFAARLQPLKAPDVVLRALALLDPAVRPRLVLAGDGSPDHPAYAQVLRELVVEAGLTDHVIFVGSLPRPELATLLRGAALAVVPSYSETFGLIALEAEASGVPVVAARGSGGLVESVIDGRTGVLVADHEPQSWADALAALLADPDRRRELGAQARAFATELTWRRSALGLAAVYADLLDGGTPQ